MEGAEREAERAESRAARERVRGLLAGPRRADPAIVPQLQGLVEALPDGIEKGDALAVLGAHALHRMDFARAEPFLARALELTWGSSDRAEMIACHNLSTVCAHDGRRFEALVLARRAHALATRAGAKHVSVAALRTLAMALQDLGDHRRLLEVVEEAEAVYGTIEEEAREKCRMSIASIRHLTAHLRKDGDAALAAVREADDGSRTPYVMEIEAGAHVSAGRPREAEALADRAAALAGPDRSLVLRLRILRVRAVLGAGEPDRARRLGHEMLSDLRRPEEPGLAPGLRLTHAEELGEIFGERLGDLAAAEQAYGIAGVAAMERSHELSAFLSRFPALRHDADVLEIVREYRSRFLRDHRRLLDAVRRLLVAPSEAPVPIPASTLVGICAWCRRVRGPDAVWVALREFTLPPDVRTVTHGICDDCLARQRAAIRGDRQS